MPVDPGMLSSVASSVPNYTDFFNGISTMVNNGMSRRFSREMYGRQYDDSIKFWQLQNAYNSPEQQMQRFRDAGLNPHLIYGQGNPGNAGNIQLPDVTPVDFRAPRFEGGRPDVMQNMLAMADLRIKNAQADNLLVQNQVIREEAFYKKFLGLRTEFDYNFEKGLEPVSADARRLGNQKMQQDLDLNMNRDAREAAMNASNVQEAAQRMLTMIEQRKSLPLERGRLTVETARSYQEIRRIKESVRQMELDGTLKQLDIDLRKQGINPNDPLWARYVGRFLSDLFDPGESNMLSRFFKSSPK